MHLTESEIHERLTRLRNLERLYAKARERIALLEAETKAQKERIRELETRDNDKNAKLEALAFQLEQLTNKVFGKKPTLLRIREKQEPVERDEDSYRRPVPKTYTKLLTHPVKKCMHCSGEFAKKSVRVFFEEDIPLPIVKSVTRHEVEVGYCSVCKRQSAGIPLPTKKVVLGERVRKYVCLLSTLNRLSHGQIQAHLSDVFSLPVSVGEIGNILTKEADTLRPEYERLKSSIMKQKAVHYDETSWKVVKEEHGIFAWVATGTESNDTVFLLGRSRGKGNLDDLGTAEVGITDDYAVYKHTFAEHQLCFAHPQRKFRELAESVQVPEKKRGLCVSAYRQFSSLYRRIRASLDTSFSPYLKRTWKRIFDDLSKPSARDPAPLSKLKTSLRKNKDAYFTFLRYPGIPVDNNKAERALRHLVLKRKISFGSKTQRGAETTSILASIIMSLKWNDPDGWFTTYLALKP